MLQILLQTGLKRNLGRFDFVSSSGISTEGVTGQRQPGKTDIEVLEEGTDARGVTSMGS